MVLVLDVVINLPAAVPICSVVRGLGPQARY